MQELAEIDKRILDILQNNFPLCTRPFWDMSNHLHINETELLLRIKAMQDAGIIRRIGGIMDSKKLGFYSTLCACTVSYDKIDEVAVVINQYPGVTHNYLRDHRYNIWFTLTAPSREEVLAIIKEIEELTNLPIMNLPAKKLYKIKVSLKMQTTCQGDVPFDTITPPIVCKKHCPLNMQKYIIQFLQGNIPLQEQPYKSLAQSMNLSEEEVINYITGMQQSGVIRRLGAILRHRQAGFTVNAMAAWKVDESQADEAGQIMAEFQAISHCYLREVPDEFGYNLFSMIHAHSDEEFKQIVNKISIQTGIEDYQILKSTRELKKVSMSYV